MAFHYIDEDMIKKTDVSVIRPRAEYAVVMHKQTIRGIEKFREQQQKWYHERLKSLSLLINRRIKEKEDKLSVNMIKEVETIEKDILLV